jgi:hypothetical protein
LAMLRLNQTVAATAKPAPPRLERNEGGYHGIT